MSDVSVDMHEIDDLAGRLGRMAAMATKERARVLGQVGEEVATAARSNARSWFTKAATGRLASSIEVAQRGVSGVRVWSPAREGFFLEYGSPTTGGPQPWLSQPAEEGADKLGVLLAKVGEDIL